MIREGTSFLRAKQEEERRGAYVASYTRPLWCAYSSLVADEPVVVELS